MLKNLYVVLVVLASILAYGCGSDAPDSPTQTQARSGTPDGMVDLGVWNGHWDGKTLSFEPANAAARTSGVRPQSFVTVPSEYLTLSTTESMTFNSSCPANEDPPNNYFITGPRYLSDSTSCPDHHLCSIVSLDNISNRDLGQVYAQVTSITSGFFADSGTNVPAAPTDLALDASLGLWNYQSLNVGAGPNTNVWSFSLPNCNTFSFTVRVMGWVYPTSYGASGKYLPTQSEWIDACSLSGHTQVLTSASADSYVSGIMMPFPFSLYDHQLRPSALPGLTISANGALGHLPVTTDNVALPDMSGDTDYSIFPFWDRLNLSAAGVCYGVTGTAPNRKLVVTWTNADLVSTFDVENLTFSAVLNETTDNIEFLYKRWSDTQTDCLGVFAPARGGEAVIGVQGAGFATQFASKLPVHDDTCPGGMYKVTFLAKPGNQQF